MIKKIVGLLLILSFMGLFLWAGNSIATTILPSPGEPDLMGSGGILDQIYGPGVLQRVDDDIDQTWWPATGCATAMAKYAGFDQEFGYISDENNNGFGDDPFVSLFSVTGNGTNLGTPTADLSSGNYDFMWALNPSGAPIWTSRQSQNSDGLDHMVTWEIINVPNAWVLAWEDLPGGGDQDYNDLVVEVRLWAPGDPPGTCPSCPGTTPVPEPATLILLGAGLIGLAGISRRKFK